MPDSDFPPEKFSRRTVAAHDSSAWLADEIRALARETGAPENDAAHLAALVARLAENVLENGADRLCLASENDAADRAFLEKFCAAPRSRSLVASPKSAAAGVPAPLVFDAAHAELCFLRNFRNESEIVEKTLALARVPAAKTLPETTENLIAAALPHALNDAQKNAVCAIVSRRLAIVSGGPGTGKTTLLLRALLCIFEQNPDAKIVLAAPTGKAASRMKESLAEQSEKIAAAAAETPSETPSPRAGTTPVSPRTLEKIAALAPKTLHRALRIAPGKLRSSKSVPISADCVVIDEASMIGRELAARLLRALSPETELVLLGDKNQLESVEPGRIFGALCEADSLAACRTELTESRRFDAHSFIGKFASAIVRGDRSAAEALLSNAAPAPQIRLSEGEISSAALRDALVSLFPEKLRRVPDDADPAEILSLIESTRLLTPLRERKSGSRLAAENINALASRLFSGDPRVAAGTTLHFHGRPILVTKNSERLFNGDVGVVLHNRDRSAARAPSAEFLAWFRDYEHGGVRAVPVELLPEHETAYAMSIHKAQGSEFSRLTVVFPRAPAENRDFYSRRLLYTAISRFRETNAPDAAAHFHLLFDRETLLDAVARNTVENSALRRRFDEEAFKKTPT